MPKIKLNNVDLAWLRMDHPINPMMITVVVKFTGRVSYEQLITDLEVVVNRFRRFRQRVVIPKGVFHRPYWDDVPSFRVEDHVERQDLPLPADDSAVQQLATEKMNTRLDFEHPLWKLTLADNHPDGSVLIIRIHHCIADGISLMRVLLSMTHASGEVNSQHTASRHLEQNPPIVSPESPTIPTMIEASQVKSKTGAGRVDIYRKPGILDMLAAIVRILFRPPDPPTILKGPLGEVKKAVWSKPFNVTEMKKIAKYKGATINDILMAVSTGAIRRYMLLHNASRMPDIRAFILVNLRGLTFDDDLGNNFGLVFLDLPVQRTSPMERLEGVKQGMDFLKASAEYAATYFILHILGIVPGWIEHLATRFLDTKGTVVATNVPGTRHELIMANAPIQTIIAWVPQSGRIGVGLSFVSYNNQLIVGLNTDAGLISDPEMFLDLFGEEYLSLQAAIAADTLDS